MNKLFFSIGAKLLAAFILIVLLTSGALTTVSLVTSRQVLENEAKEKLDTIADLKISQLRLWVARNENILSGLTGINIDFYNHLLELSEESSPALEEDIYEHANRFLLLNPAFTSLLIFNPESGALLFSTDLTDDLRLHQLFEKEDPHFLEKANSATLMMPIVHSSLLGESALMISTPLRDVEGRARLILAGHLNPLAMSDILSDRYGLGETGLTYLVGENGRVLAGSPYQFIVDQPISSYGIQQGQLGGYGTAFYQNFLGSEVIGYYHYLPDFNAIFMAEQNRDEALAVVAILENKLFLFIGIILVIVIFLAFIFAGRLSRPIRRLTAVARAITQGKFNLRAEIQSHDEIGTLAESFNTMANQILSSSEESKNIIETMPEALFTLKADGTIHFLNRQALLLTDYKMSQMIGKPFMDFLVKDLVTDGMMERLRRHHKITEERTYFYNAHHHKIPVNLSMTLVESKKEEEDQTILAVIRDLRDLRHYAKERLATVIPYLQKISLGDFEAQLPSVEASDEFSDLFAGVGLMADNLQELIQENAEKTEKLGHSHQQLEEAHRHLLAASDTLTQEKTRAEALLNSIGDAVVAVNPQGRILWFNRHAHSLFDLETEAIGKKSLDAFVLYDARGILLTEKQRSYAQVAQRRKSLTKEFNYKRPNGELIPLVVVSSPVMVKQKLLGVITVYHDITKEKAIDKAKSEFVSLASHQLRTPLTSIRWILEEVIRKKGSPKANEEYLRDALQSTQRMIRLVSDLLNLSRIEAGAIDVEPQETNLADLVAEVVLDARASIDQHRQTVVVHKPKDGIPLHADPVLVRQVITNLFSNALKYSDPDKTVTITVEKKNSKAWITLQDQGIGIPEDQQSRVYEKFFRTEEASKRSTTGSGLGMYLVKKIITALRGEISFTSVSGKGTTFRVGLPLKFAVAHKASQKLIETHIS